MSKTLSTFATQNNTQPGFITGVADGVLTDLEGRLLKITADGYAVPSTVYDLALFLLLDGAADEGRIALHQVSPESNVRIRANGTGSKGDVLVLCDPSASAGVNAGKVQTVGTTEGRYFSVGIAEEDFIDEQLVLVRVLPRIVNIGTAFTAATPVATAATNSAPYGFATQAQADALVTNVRELRAWAVAQGFKATS